MHSRLVVEDRKLQQASESDDDYDLPDDDIEYKQEETREQTPHDMQHQFPL